jgi:hypothetical protein
MAAWRYPARSFRALLLIGYFTGGYIGGLLVAVFMQ